MAVYYNNNRVGLVPVTHQNVKCTNRVNCIFRIHPAEDSIKKKRKCSTWLAQNTEQYVACWYSASLAQVCFPPFIFLNTPFACRAMTSCWKRTYPWQGFNDGVDTVWHGDNGMLAAIKALCEEEGKNRKLYISGHSLGGALATIAGARLAFEHDMKIAGIYTIGSPRCRVRSAKVLGRSQDIHCVVSVGSTGPRVSTISVSTARPFPVVKASVRLRGCIHVLWHLLPFGGRSVY